MEYVSIEPPIDLRALNNAQARTVLGQPHYRSSGTHLTEILSRMNRDSGRMKEKIVFGRNTFDPLDEDDMPMCMALGMSWEMMLLRIYPWISKVPEVSKDGIAMSPDGASFNCSRHLLCPQIRVPVVCEEIKLTWKSSNRGLEEYFNYLQQTKSYCYGMGTNYCRLHVCHVNGNYHFGNDDAGGPHYTQYHIKFTNFELQSNWDEVKRRKAEYEL